MNYYKVLDYDGSAFHGGWGKWTPGRWRSVRGKLIPCERGLHVCALEQLPEWLGPTIWRAEVHPSSEIILCEDKIVVRKARIVEQLPWDERTASLFAADCAEHVLHLYESVLPGDDRPRRAIEAARAYTNGEIGDKELEAARDDAWYARDAARVAAGYAASAASYAASAASWASLAAGYAASAAGYAASAAGWAAWRSDGDTARASERRWQAERLANYLGL